MIRNLIALAEISIDLRKREADLLKIKKKRLQKMLCYVYAHVPFYRQYFNDIRYNPNTDFSGFDDLKKLPVINKQTIRKHGYDQFISNEYEIAKLKFDHSSGSTGEPFRFYRDPNFYAYQLAIFMAVLRRYGYKFTDKMLSFSNPARLQTGRSILQRFNLIRRLPIDFNLSPGESLDIILKYRPHIMFGNPSSFELLCMEMKKRDIRIDFVKIIFAGGTSVTDACQQACHERFGVYVTEFYGAIEFSTLAYKQWNENYYHLCNEQMIFEFLDENNHEVNVGEQGRVVLTSLRSKAMPLIRYDIGDLATTTVVKNRYGEDSLKIKHIDGRDCAIAELKDGRRIAYQHIFSLLNKHIGILQFKVVQETLDHFKIYLVPESDSYFQDNFDTIRSKFDNLFKDSASYTIEKVSELSIERGGKVKTFVPLTKQLDHKHY